MHEKNSKFRSNVTRAPRKQTVALAWYSETDYENILAIMADREDLPDTYQEWLDQSLEVEKKLFEEGYPVTRILIQPKHFPSWCRIHGLKPNAKARAEFAAKQALRKARLK